MRFLVLGGGAQGTAAAFDLVRRDGVTQVVVADQRIGDPFPALEPFVGDRLSFISVDARDEDRVRTAMTGMDAVVCALPYYFNLPMTRLAVEVGAHFCDLGGNTEIVAQQKTLDEAAKAAGVSVVPDCGVAPGMVNILAQAGIGTMDTTHSVRVRVGGLPQHPKPPLNYQIVYSMHGVIDYYTTPSLVIEEGRMVEVEALSDLETVPFPEPVGDLEAFHTAGGISTLPARYEGRIREMNYKTLRYPGHAAQMRLIRELGLLDTDPVTVNGTEVVPRHLFIECVSPKLRNEAGEDLLALRVEVDGDVDGVAKSVRYDLLDYYDADTGFTAMNRTTGFSLAITALMQADGRIGPTGVMTPDECVPAEAYIRELATHGVDIQRTEG